MPSRLDSYERDSGPNGTAMAARAHELVAHGRAHLDYQRRIAAETVDRHDPRVVGHEPKGTA